MQVFAGRVISQFSHQAEIKGLDFKKLIIDPELILNCFTDETISPGFE